MTTLTHPASCVFSPTDWLSDEGIVAHGGPSRRDPDPFLPVPDGDGARPPATTQGVLAAPQKQSKRWEHESGVPVISRASPAKL